MTERQRKLAIRAAEDAMLAVWEAVGGGSRHELEPKQNLELAKRLGCALQVLAPTPPLTPPIDRAQELAG